MSILSSSLTNIVCSSCRKSNEKRVEANDPAAICKIGSECQKKGDFASAFNYWAEAAELGDAEAIINYQSCIVRETVLRRILQNRKYIT